MNSDQIKEEARRRVAQMTEQEKEDIWGFSPEENEFLRYVDKVGSKNLNPEQKSKFRQMLVHFSTKSMPGGPFRSAMTTHVQEHFSISKDDLRKGGVKNPYKAHIYKDIAVGLVLAAGGAVLAVSGVGAPAALAVEASAGVCAMDFARQIKNYFDFKKLQKAYSSGAMDEEEIRSEMLNEIFEERHQRWLR